MTVNDNDVPDVGEQNDDLVLNTVRIHVLRTH